MAKKAAAGPNPLFDLEAFRAWQKERKATPEAFKQHYKRALVTERKLNHVDGAGWHMLPSKPEMRKLTDPLTGQLYDMPVNDYEHFLSFIRTDSELSELFTKTGKLKDATTPADYIDYVFNKSKRKKLTQEGCGHIAMLEYDPFYQLLRVTFTSNGAVVVYFRVPGSVANVLIALAQSGAMGTGRHGDPRHLLGIYFWDLVRIRGTIHGSRYAFEYTHGAPSGKPSGRKQGGYYQVSTDPTVKDLRTIISDRRAKMAAANMNVTAKDDPELKSMERDLKEVNKALADGDMGRVELILNKYDLSDRLDTTRAVYTPTGQLDPATRDDIEAGIKENLRDARRGMSALVSGSDSDYHSTLTEAIDTYLNSSAKEAASILADYVQPTIARMDARASLMTTNHKRAYHNLAKPRIADEGIDESIGAGTIMDRSVAALVRQEQYLIRLGLWP